MFLYSLWPLHSFLEVHRIAQPHWQNFLRNEVWQAIFVLFWFCLLIIILRNICKSNLIWLGPHSSRNCFTVFASLNYVIYKLYMPCVRPKGTSKWGRLTIFSTAPTSFVCETLFCEKERASIYLEEASSPLPKLLEGVYYLQKFIFWIEDATFSRPWENIYWIF